MKYIERELERKLLEMSKIHPVIMITGAKQVGKTTMLRHLCEHKRRSYVTLENPSALELARENPITFVQVHRPPIIIDEIQKAPDLIRAIVLMAAALDKNGLYWLAGHISAGMLEETNYALLRQICILPMLGLSQHEKASQLGIPAMTFDTDELKARKPILPPDLDLLFNSISQGDMPTAQNLNTEQLGYFYKSYIHDYILKDARNDREFRNGLKLIKVLQACVDYIGQPINYSKVGRAADMASITAKKCVDALKSMGIIYLLEPYSKNPGREMSQNPRLYFCDTGLAAYLNSWNSGNAVFYGTFGKRFFNNYIVMELLKMYSCSDSLTNMSFYRDANQRKIDLVLELDGVVHPIQIIQSGNPDPNVTHPFKALKSDNTIVGKGGNYMHNRKSQRN